MTLEDLKTYINTKGRITRSDMVEIVGKLRDVYGISDKAELYVYVQNFFDDCTEIDGDEKIAILNDLESY